MSFYDSAIKYAIKILNKEPNYSLDRLRKISEKAYVIAKRYIDDINSSKKNVERVLYAGLIRNLSVSFINNYYNGWNLINNGMKNINPNMFWKGAHVLATNEEEYCSKLAPYVPRLTQLNLRINQLRLKIDTVEAEMRRLARENNLMAFMDKSKEIMSLMSEVVKLRDERWGLILEFMKKEKIR